MLYFSDETSERFYPLAAFPEKSQSASSDIETNCVFCDFLTNTRVPLLKLDPPYMSEKNTAKGYVARAKLNVYN